MLFNLDHYFFLIYIQTIYTFIPLSSTFPLSLSLSLTILDRSTPLPPPPQPSYMFHLQPHHIFVSAYLHLPRSSSISIAIYVSHGITAVFKLLLKLHSYFINLIHQLHLYSTHFILLSVAPITHSISALTTTTYS